MKKIAYLFGITFLILQSCSSSDNDSNTSSYVLVRKTIETFPQGAYTTTYEYSGNKIVSATAQLNGEVLTGYYTYTGDFISEFNIFGSGNFLREKYIYNYTLDNKVASFIQLDYQNNTGKRATYTYNADGTILSNEYWGSLTSQTTLFNTKTIFFQNGEVSSVIENNGSSIKTL